MSYGQRTKYGQVGGGVGKRPSYFKRGKEPKRRAVQYPAGPRLSLTETKYFDTGFNAQVTSGAADWTATEVPMDNYVNASGTAAAYTDSNLLPTAIGSGYGQVNGNKYSLIKIRCRGRLIALTDSDQADVPASIPYRLILVKDSQPNGAQAQGEDIMQDVGAAETLYSYQRVADNPGRFKILKSMMGVINVSAVGTDGTNTQSVGYIAETFSFQWKPRSPVVVNVKSGNAVPTIAGAVNCNIFLLLHNTNKALTIQGASRAYYLDH